MLSVCSLGIAIPPWRGQAILDWAYGGTAPTAAVPFLTQLLQDPLACGSSTP